MGAAHPRSVLQALTILDAAEQLIGGVRDAAAALAADPNNTENLHALAREAVALDADDTRRLAYIELISVYASEVASAGNFRNSAARTSAIGANS